MHINNSIFEETHAEPDQWRIHFWTKLRPEGPKKYFGIPPPPPLSKGLDDRPTPLPLSQGLDPALVIVLYYSFELKKLPQLRVSFYS